MSDIENESMQNEKILQLMRQAIEEDEKLREKYEIGDKFRFVRERLKGLFDTIEKEVSTTLAVAKKTDKVLSSDELPVYVYLYNSKGMDFRSWSNMLAPKVFYEYSVNRPIYKDKSAIDEFLKLKTNKTQHAYLTIAIYPSDIISEEGGMVRIREGSLRFERLLGFTHNDQEYILNERGGLVKK
jgi:hypothetical protein